MRNSALIPIIKPFVLLLKTAGTILLLSGLPACSLVPPQAQMNVQAGESLTLNQPISIHAGATRTFIQKGQVIAKRDLDRYAPHCSLEVRDLSDQDSTIQPDTFQIEKVRNDVLLIVGTDQPFGTLAQNDYSVRSRPATHWQAFADSDQGQPDPTYDAVRLYLASPTQPNVFRLTCAGSLSDGNPMDAPDSYRPQRNEINRILGPIGRIGPAS